MDDYFLLYKYFILIIPMTSLAPGMGDIYLNHHAVSSTTYYDIHNTAQHSPEPV